MMHNAMLQALPGALQPACRLAVHTRMPLAMHVRTDGLTKKQSKAVTKLPVCHTCAQIRRLCPFRRRFAAETRRHQPLSTARPGGKP